MKSVFLYVSAINIFFSFFFLKITERKKKMCWFPVVVTSKQQLFSTKKPQNKPSNAIYTGPERVKANCWNIRRERKTNTSTRKRNPLYAVITLLLFTTVVIWKIFLGFARVKNLNAFPNPNLGTQHVFSFFYVGKKFSETYYVDTYTRRLGSYLIIYFTLCKFKRDSNDEKRILTWHWTQRRLYDFDKRRFYLGISSD